MTFGGLFMIKSFKTASIFVLVLLSITPVLNAGIAKNWSKMAPHDRFAIKFFSVAVAASLYSAFKANGPLSTKIAKGSNTFALAGIGLFLAPIALNVIDGSLEMARDIIKGSKEALF
jgi:hypothetical protein